jgi:4-hydroxymandelate oxidase
VTTVEGSFDGADRGPAAVRALIASFRATVTERVEPTVADYFAGGSGDEVSLAEADAAWSNYRLRPRVLTDVSTVDVRTAVLGADLASPVGIAPMGFQGLLDPDGEVAVVAGAGRHLTVVSTRASRPIEEIAAAAPGPWWFQVYVTAERERSLALAERAAAAGAAALVLTGDTPYVARKARAGRPVALGESHTMVNFGPDVPPAATEQNPAATTADIERLAEVSGLPVLVKGVLRGDDTRRCLEAGAAGVVVSNHGGRQLDRAVASAHALAEVVAAAGPAPVLVDGGIRCGLDVLTALALGARAVLVGRPFAWALGAGGRSAIARLAAAFDDDLAHVLGLAGCADVAAAGPDLLVAAPATTSPGVAVPH